MAALMVGLGVGIPLGRYLTTPPVDGGPVRPMAYQVLYRTRSDAGGTGSTSAWELLTVQRPFEASDFTYASRPGPRSRPDGGALFTRDRLYAWSDGTLEAVSGRQPGAPGYDQDLLTQMPDLESRGLAASLGSTETVDGRACSLYRFAEPPSGPVAPLSKTGHDDLCIDSEGLILDDVWTLKGRVVQSRRAVQVTVGPVRSPFEPTSSTLSSSAVATAEPDPGARTFLPTPSPPPGFEAIVPENLIEPDPQGSGALVAAEVIWAFTKGPNVISVEAGNSAPGQLPWSGTSTVTRPLTLTGLGPARSAIDSDGAEIRVSLGDGQWVRISGTVPLSGLTRYADTLKPPV